jgi:hypothetical protein
MKPRTKPVLRTRRRLLQAATAWPAFRALQAARRDFWQDKAPTDWSSEEKQIILEQSPWARQGIVLLAAERKRAPQPSPGATRPGGGVPGARPNERLGEVASVPIGQPMPPVPRADTGPPVQFRVLARWESAQPVRLAGGPELPKETEGFYVIRLRGMPLLPPPKSAGGENVPNPNQGLLDAIKQSARIERRDGTAISCTHLLTGSGDSATELLLFFPRGEDPITVQEKEVNLECSFGPFHLSVKFPLKEMTYKGALAL